VAFVNTPLPAEETELELVFGWVQAGTSVSTKPPMDPGRRAKAST
jgi:hypothetical protein